MAVLFCAAQVVKDDDDDNVDDFQFSDQAAYLKETSQPRSRQKRFLFSLKKKSKSLGSIFSKTITIKNNGESNIEIQCGRDKNDYSEKKKILHPDESENYKFNPIFNIFKGSFSYWCTAGLNGKKITFPVYGAGAPTKENTFKINEKGIYLKGEKKHSW